TPPVQVQPPEPPPPDPIPEPVTPVAVPEPLPADPPTSVQPVIPAPVPKLEPAPALVTPNPVRGDASAPKPGLDSTTLLATVGVRAHPAYRKTPEPIYPLAARRRGQQGTVLLSVTVTAQGRAAFVRIKQTSGVPSLDEAAVSAVKSWEFEPARVNQSPIESE